jgi:hypothetical protein
MKSQTKRLFVLALVANLLGGCGGGGGNAGGGNDAGAPPPASNPPATTPADVGFTSYSKQMHAVAENDQPWDVDTVTFTFDGDQDPHAYDDLLPPEG